MNRQEKEYLVEKIRTQYTEKEFTELDALKALNKKVTRPAKLFGYIFGSVSALIMGSGMSLIMTDIAETLKIGNSLAIGLIIGIIGLLMAIFNYPVYSAFLTARRKKYAAEIIKLSDKIMES